MNSRKTLAALLIGVIASFGISTPAYAVLGCSADAVCYYDSGYSNEYPFIDHDDADTSPGYCHNMAISHRNKASYIRNWTDHQWTVYTGLQCSGTSGPLYAETSGVMTGIYQNNIESYRRVG